MQFNEDAELDTSQIDDQRGGGGGGGIGGRVAAGGGGLGVVGLIIYFLLSQFTGGGGGVQIPSGFGDVGQNQQVDSSALRDKCKTGADANREDDCRAVAFINSIQAYWSDQFARSGKTYQPVKTNFFQGGVSTGCGSASSDAGPFYCPADAEVYIDLAFFQELKTTFGATGGPFVEAYVLAHEYGHHVQDLNGTSDRVKEGTGPTSDSVRLELQADCYAGAWANHATNTPTASGKPLITGVTDDDVNAALDAASRIGDDFIQKNLGGGNVDSSQFSHGSSAQRQKWYRTGYESGDPTRCGTFDTNDLG
ncbi:neutral zinc metallopeptidase [Umezawaea sp. Da 62-37]|uniref:KPN_02809 family neutral zinc metallopeptidase n=1 Tax=Umezawaea sp. Da 62-37 TaxID=3075927 RepID=UPI0028F706FD|nr:neutral zinc metallopeptidase [Umezawaea sp. Da 62-37]WNV91603.1 neutral zinc metallopeptidase [Umezawaea sp. Da 62-37]